MAEQRVDVHGTVRRMLLQKVEHRWAIGHVVCDVVCDVAGEGEGKGALGEGRTRRETLQAGSTHAAVE
jgi:hypothetical protein